MLRTLLTIVSASLLLASCGKQENVAPFVEEPHLNCFPTYDPAESKTIKTEVVGTRNYRVAVKEEYKSGNNVTTTEDVIDNVTVNFYMNDSEELQASTGSTEVRLTNAPLEVMYYDESNMVAMNGKDISGTVNQGNYKSAMLKMMFDRNSKQTSDFTVTYQEYNIDNELTITYTYVQQ